MSTARYLVDGRPVTCEELAEMAGVSRSCMTKRLMAIQAKPGDSLPDSVLSKKISGIFYTMEENGKLKDVSLHALAKRTLLTRTKIVQKLDLIGIKPRGRVTQEIINRLSSTTSDVVGWDSFNELKPTQYNLRYSPRSEPYKNGTVFGAKETYNNS